MLPPLLSQNSRQLLTRFFARESRLSLLKEASLSAPSTSTSTSQEASTSTSQPSLHSNPFKGQLVKNAKGHSKLLSPRYSLRRQKQLLKAMEFVKLQEELFAPVVATVGETSAQSSSVESSDNNPFKVPQHWKLPPSVKSKELPSFFSPDQDIESTPSARFTAKEATTRGPYKGRKEAEKPFKLHTWERNKAKVMAERKAKLQSMPERIEDYRKARVTPE